ncbi:MAG TPA: DegT/DnrJ/EryC1/StrS family aminotransferase [bacterium]|nr:DegT/DnrJ/EryC1/StrS family aminotransferase [bacterium]HOM26650.1 DegT/DnrJ/EryC1/StrS family aminotransferase [bacterium]
MKIENEELKGIIDLWDLKKEIKKEIFKLLDENPALSPAHLFRYYVPEGKKDKVGQFEKEFAEKFGSKYALAVNSGTSALIASLIACGIGPGDEVIIPGYTFFATCSAVLVAKAIPVIAEIDETLTIDPDDIEKKITKYTKAIMPVHMRGLPSNMEKIMKMAKKYNLKVIEDCAQADGGSYKGKHLGTFGDAGCFSFDFYKIINTGEGGMVVTDDEKIYIRAQSWHDTAACWRPNRYARERIPGELFYGENYRMGQINAAIGLAQLKKLDSYLKKMRKNKKMLIESIGEVKRVKYAPVNDPEGECATNLVFLTERAEEAKKLMENLKKEKVPAGGIYDKDIRDWHIYKYWEHIIEKKTPTEEGCPFTCSYYKGKLPSYSEDMCPNTLDILSRVLIIGISENWKYKDIKEIAKKIKKYIN